MITLSREINGCLLLITFLKNFKLLKNYLFFWILIYVKKISHGETKKKNILFFFFVVFFCRLVLVFFVSLWNFQRKDVFLWQLDTLWIWYVQQVINADVTDVSRNIFFKQVIFRRLMTVNWHFKVTTLW